MATPSFFRPGRLLLLLSMSLAVMAGCGPTADPTPISIGVIAPYTGEYQENGIDTRNAAELAVSEVNARGGLLVGGQRRPVALVYGDDQDSPENAVTVAKRLINQDKVVALVGVPFSRIAIPVANVAEEARVPLISSTSTNPETTRGKRYVFRATFTDPFQGSVLARFARADLKAGRAAVLYDEASEYNRGIAEIFRQVFTEQGGSVVAFETYVTGATDWGAQLERIKASNPDVLLLPNYYTEVPDQVKQAHALGITAPLLGGDGWDVAAHAPLPEFEGSFITLNWHPDVANEQARVFIAAYRQAYQNKIPSDIHANTYDAFGLLFQAIERAGSADPDAIRDQLATTTDYRGVTGEITFSGSGDPVKSAVIIAIHDGKDHFYQTIDP